MMIAHHCLCYDNGMELGSLIEALSDPSAYPHPVDTVEVRQTHISVVFLAGAHVYKIKKPLELGFLDYSTLAKRKFFCDEEARVNRRLAADVYLGTFPITGQGSAVRVEGGGEVLEWAVKMKRLSAEATLRERVRRNTVGPEQVTALAQRIAAFHAGADAGPSIAACGRFAVIARNARDNFVQTAVQVGTAVSKTVFDRIQALTEASLTALEPLMEQRAERGVPRDGHGDLRLDHVYFFPEREPPADFVVIDGIEFNERFRAGDPVADIAFLVMDLIFEGRSDLACAFRDAYLRESNDDEGRSLVPFYTAYRAVVRGKVEGIEASELEVPENERVQALASARAHWLLSLGALEEAGRRPCLVLVAGLPGVGKSTLARELADRAGFTLIRSDAVRKELARRHGVPETAAGFETGIYSPEWTERTYSECLERVGRELFEGRRVLVDANFWSEALRSRFLSSAHQWGVLPLLLHCRAESAIVRQRLDTRQGDTSDADWLIHRRAAERWEELSPETARFAQEIDTGKNLVESLAQAVDTLRKHGLAGDAGGECGKTSKGLHDQSISAK